jgi:hypothetical protein
MSVFNNRYIQNPTLLKFEIEYDSYYKIFDTTIKRWNNRVRDYYRRNMQVNLQPNKTDLESRQIPVRIHLDYNNNFIDKIEAEYPQFDFDEYSTLKDFVKISQQTLRHFKDKRAARSLENAIEYANERLSQFDVKGIQDNLFQFLNPVNKDVFGAYWLGNNHVEIYILPIVLFCKLHQFNLQDFIVVVLAHEIAHGLHHIGYDKDNHWWHVFDKTDDNLAEGLAQYYTHRFAESQFNNRDGIMDTFQALLPYQPSPYLYHKRWLKSEYTLEIMYRALIEARRQDIIDYKAFSKILRESKARLV